MYNDKSSTELGHPASSGNQEGRAGLSLATSASGMAKSRVNVGTVTTSPSERLEVGENGKKSFEVRPGTGYVSLLVDGVEVARLRN